MGYRIGVDVGGTFADFAVLNAEGQLFTLKVPSAPEAPGSEIIEGVNILNRRFGISPEDVVHFTHGLTVGVNTLIQRVGARLALVTNKGFEDVLDLGRLRVPEVFSLFSKRPLPLIGRESVYGVHGRINSQGAVRQDLDAEEVEAVLASIVDQGFEGVVVSFLNAYRNPEHEYLVKALAEKSFPGLAVTCSAEVWPVIREYERTLTAVLNAYIEPQMGRYLTSFQNKLAELGIPAKLQITKSNGGVMSASLGEKSGVQVLLSGTASGVIGASHIARAAGLGDVVSLDIGGTSADVAVIVDGEPSYGAGQQVGDFILHVPAVQVSSIGAGGGSIARLDAQGVLKCGPESAGSSPGPACYGRGGDRPTVTDAFVTCGFLGDSDLGYGSIQIDRSKAVAAVETLADPLGLTSQAIASSIIHVAVSGMFAGMNKVFARQGIEPNSFTLLAFGGAGPMMACFLAREMGFRSVLIPPNPGVLSAFGGLIAETKGDFVKTFYGVVDGQSVGAIASAFAELENEARNWIVRANPQADDVRVSYFADMRYEGQAFELETEIPAESLETLNPAKMAEAFHICHRQHYGHADSAAPVQAVNLRVVISCRNPSPKLQVQEMRRQRAEPSSWASVYFDGNLHRAGIFSRDELLPGAYFDGPAIIHQNDTTSCMLDGFRGYIDALGNLIMENVMVPEAEHSKPLAF
jgi:N-methylhydantoinase A